MRVRLPRQFIHFEKTPADSKASHAESMTKSVINIFFNLRASVFVFRIDLDLFSDWVTVSGNMEPSPKRLTLSTMKYAAVPRRRAKWIRLAHK